MIVSGFYENRPWTRSGGNPTSSRASLKTGAEHSVRREGKRQAQRDIKRFELYLFVERGVSPLTVKKYLREVKRLKAWSRSKRKSLSDLTPTDCRRWLNSLKEESSEPYKPSTINGKLSIAKIFFRFLITEGDLLDSPFESIPFLPIKKPSQRFLSQEEIEQLLAVPDVSTYSGLLDRTIMELFYASGIRVAELVDLRLDSVNLERRLIHCTGKGSKERYVVFGRSAREWLKKYLVARADVPGAQKSHYLFLKKDGKRIYGTYVWRRVKAHARKAGLDNVSPHVLRHSFATHMHNGGASTQEVQQLLGHDGGESTEIYTHLVQIYLKNIYERHHPRASFNRKPPRRRGSQRDTESEE